MAKLTKLVTYLAIVLILADIAFFSAMFLHKSRHKVYVEHPVTERVAIAKVPSIPIAPIVQTEEDQREEEIGKCTIKIMGTLGTGTGVVIYQDKKIAYIITALHVIDPIESWGFYQDDKHTVFEPMKTVATNKLDDLAILSSEPKWDGVAHILLDTNLLKRGQTGYTLGLILGSDWEPMWSMGIISILKTTEALREGNSERMEASIPVIFGNSGGGVFVKINGHYQLVGIVTNVRTAFYRGQPLIVNHIAITTTAVNTLEFIQTTIGNNK